MSTVKTHFYGGVPFVTYNTIGLESNEVFELNGDKYKGFYVSYNDYDTIIYGDVTTAIVLEGDLMEFIILNGNHTEAIKNLKNEDGVVMFEDCLNYCKEHISKLNKKFSTIEIG